MFFRKVSWAKSFTGITIFLQHANKWKTILQQNPEIFFIRNHLRLTTFIIFEFNKMMMTMFYVSSLKLGLWFLRRNDLNQCIQFLLQQNHSLFIIKSVIPIMKKNPSQIRPNNARERLWNNVHYISEILYILILNFK